MYKFNKALKAVHQQFFKTSEFSKPIVGDIYLVIFRNKVKLKDSITFNNQSFIGICTSTFKRSNPLSSFYLRNVFNKDPIDYNFFFNSPMIKTVKLIAKSTKNYYVRNKLYYLKQKKLKYSRVSLRKLSRAGRLIPSSIKVM